MNRRLVDHVSPLIPVRLYGKPDVAIGHAVPLLPNVQAFFPTRLRVELCSLGPISAGVMPVPQRVSSYTKTQRAIVRFYR